MVSKGQILEELSDNFRAGENEEQEMSLQEKINESILAHVRKELQKGKKYRTIRREVFRKTGIVI